MINKAIGSNKGQRRGTKKTTFPTSPSPRRLHGFDTGKGGIEFICYDGNKTSNGGELKSKSTDLFSSNRRGSSIFISLLFQDFLPRARARSL